MSNYDIAIVGGGLAGSTAAAMLGRAGVRTALIDPHQTYPADFRCEKLDVSQVALLRKTGLAESVLSAGSLDTEVWLARLGRFVGKRHYQQYGMAYATLVNAMRAAIPRNVERIVSKAAAFSLSPDAQTVTLSSGETITARLIILANGLNTGLRQALGMEREIISPAHSVSIGFDLKPSGRACFDFASLTYGPEHHEDRIAYLTLFPIGAGMRANLFVYRDMRDPWLKQMRDAPVETLFGALPGLRKLMGDFEVTSFVQIRPVDLYVTQHVERPGLVLVGDAFGTSCPAAGTGLNKVFTDVERLCHVYVPEWLATPGMGQAKIVAFYADPIKRDCDRRSAAKAHRLKAYSISPGLYWQLLRRGRFAGLYAAFRLKDAQRAIRHLWASPRSRPQAGTVGPALENSSTNLAIAGAAPPTSGRGSDA